MRTGPASSPPSASSVGSAGSRWRSVAIVLPAVIVMVILAVPFVGDRSILPFGRDTGGYIWRSNVAHDLGLQALGDDPKGLGDRPGHAVLVSVLRSLTAKDGLEAAWVFPLALSAAVAMAAGALAAGGRGGSALATSCAAVGVGASTLVIWTAVGYAANLLIDPVSLALAAVLLHAVRGGSGSVVASAVLLGGATAIHWVFSLLTIAIVGPVVASYELWPARRLRPVATRHPRKPTLALAGGIAVGAGAMLLFPRLPVSPPTVDPDHIASFVSLRLESFRSPLVAGLAVVGLVAGLFRQQEGWGLSLLASWSLPAGIGLAAWWLFDLPTPPYRWVGFALGLPLLASLSGPWLRERLSIEGSLVRSAAFLLALVPAGVLAISGAQVWWARSPRIEPATFAELETVSSYLESSAPRAVPVVASLRPGNPGKAAALAFRAGLPGSRALEATTIGLSYRRGFDAEPIFGPNAIVLHLESLRARPPPTGTLLGPGVWLLQGPDPQATVVPGDPPRAPGPVELVVVSAGWLTLLAFAGSGWATSLHVSLGERIGLAPAFGIAATVLAGVILSRAGIRPAGWGALSILVIATAGGWGVAALSPDRSGRDEGQPDP